MRKPRLLDLFCGGGGAGMGYRRAGFEVVGVDIAPQPRYPFKFYQADALEFLAEHGSEYDVIHASPPCQEYSKSTRQWRGEGRNYPDMIARVRYLLVGTGKPYIIENVPGSPLLNPILLNGVLFGLYVHRPRYLECSILLSQPLLPCQPSPVKMGRPVKEGDYIQPVGHFSWVAYAKKQMEIDWMGQKELAQAIPPAYTEYIGKRIMEALS